MAGMKIKVYIAGPYTKGDVAVNVSSAIDVADELMEMGLSPYVPHLTHFWHMMYPRPIVDWYDHDIEWLLVCDAVYRIPGESVGADGECERAGIAGIPVFTDLGQLKEWATKPLP